MSTFRYYIIIFLLSLPLLVFSQTTYYENDSIFITLKDYAGEIQWQKSYDTINWFDLTNETKDSILFIADSTTLFRAKVEYGLCSFYSDSVLINIKKIGLPTVTTAAISDETSNSAICGGNITDNGGDSLIERGICWSTDPAPTISDSIIIDGSGSDNYICNISGLSANTDYYVRAYATNSIGTAYGNEESFTTNYFNPFISTATTTSVTTNSAISGGGILGSSNDIIEKGVCWDTSPNPTISNNKTIDGSGGGFYTSNIVGLSQGIKYYVRAYATNGANIKYGDEQEFTTNVTCPLTVTDVDSNTYNVVAIGSQCWMAENLAVTCYPDSTPIPLVTGNIPWQNVFAGEKAWTYYNDSLLLLEKYGALYSWAAAVFDTSGSSANPSGIQGVCPDGWHLPSDDEWTILMDCIGSLGFSGRQGIAIRTTSGWDSGYNGTDNFNFSALPAGYRTAYGHCNWLGSWSGWWSSTKSSSTQAYYRYTDWGSNNVWRYEGSLDNAKSVRCVMD